MKQYNIKIYLFYFYILLFGAFSAGLTGCATIMNGTKQKIAVSSSPSNVKVLIDGYKKGYTPVVIDVERSNKNTILRFEKENYESGEIILTRDVDGWVAGNLLFGPYGIAGLAIDYMSGGSYNLRPAGVYAILKETKNTEITNSQLSHYEVNMGKKIMQDYKEKEIIENDLSGPRFGFTVINDKLQRNIKKEHDIEIHNKILTQFGWQFEKRILLEGKDMMFVTEVVPLIGGVDQNLSIPSITGAIGIRTKNGTEFALGPYASGGGTSIAYAGGVTFRYGDMNIPLNIAIVPFTDGTSLNILTGFNW
ncbi:MAG: PEGA domain-containing protein [Candidatus Firestonebacteria bacterium]|nr:PEGA domain-containing protein [Candidatus Firestonebacteria bacterium]